jgi:hypothetical protein
MLDKLWILLHLFAAFSFVGSLVVSEWNGRAARATSDWAQRALLFGIAVRSARFAGFVPLIVAGLLGNVAAVRLGYRMSTDHWLQIVNALWLAALIVLMLLVIPAGRQVTSAAAGATGDAVPPGYASGLARWRFGNVLLSLLYVALLALMVFPFRS